MAISKNITDLEKAKFAETTSGKTSVLVRTDIVEGTLLNAVEKTGAGTAIAVSDCSYFSFHTTKTGTATVKIEVSLDGTTWFDSTIVDANGLDTLTGKFKYIRANCSAYTDGTATVKFIAGN